MAKRIDYKIGDKIGDCIFMRELPQNGYWGRRAVFICSCGEEYEANVRSARKREVKRCKSCVLKKKSLVLITRNTTHGMSLTPEYRCYADMKKRCYNKKNSHYRNYGGRGIVVCKRWLESFDNFISDMGPMSAGKYSIERKDVNGHYEPNNCIWLLKNLQALNTRRSRYLTFNGEKRLLKEWAKDFAISARTLHSRVFRQGMTIENALTKPVVPIIRRKIFPEVKYSFGFINA